MPGEGDDRNALELTERGTSLLSLTGLLLDAAGDASRWPRFLTAFTAEFDAFAGQIMFVDHRAVESSLHCLVGLAPEIVESLGPRYLELAMYDDPRSPLWLEDRRHPAYGKFTLEERRAILDGRAIHCRMLVTDEIWHASTMFREVCGPAGIEYGLTIVRQLPDEWSLNVALMRGPRDSPFTERDCRRLEAWLPHIERAVKIHRRLESSSHDLDVAFSVLDALNVGVLLVDDLLELKFANRVARKLLGRGDCIRAPEHRLKVADRDAHSRLVDAARRQGSDPLQGGGLPIVVHGPGRQPAYSLLVTPVWECLKTDTDAARGRPGAVVFVAPCEQKRNVDSPLLETMWGLTRAESRVVQRILAGASVAEAASALGVTDNTVRKHLKAVFSKTGTRSQADLVRSVAGSTAWFVSAEGDGQDAGMVS